MARRSVTVLAVFIGLSFAGGRALAGDSAQWAGFYAGINYGAAVAAPEMKTTTVYNPSGNLSFADVQAINAAGDIKPQTAALNYSAHAGYNFDLGSGLVAGLQADFGSMAFKIDAVGAGTYSSSANKFQFTQAALSSWTGMVRPRIGYDLNGLLLYGTGGVAFSNVGYQSTFADTAGGFEIGGSTQFPNSPQMDNIIVGWLAGLGAEIKLNSGLSLNSEALYINYGNVAFTNTDAVIGGSPSPANVFTNTISLTNFSFQMAVNYRL